MAKTNLKQKYQYYRAMVFEERGYVSISGTGALASLVAAAFSAVVAANPEKNDAGTHQPIFMAITATMSALSSITTKHKTKRNKGRFRGSDWKATTLRYAI